jgi:hypothetical protein
VDGVVGDQTWSVSLHAASATPETAVWVELRHRLTTYVWDGLRGDLHDLSTLCKPLPVPEREGLKWQQQKS